MQNFTTLPSGDTIDVSLPKILANDKTAISLSSGIAFPVTNLQIGMLCFRTDLAKIYVLKDAAPTWVEMLDLAGAVAYLNDPTFTGTPTAPTQAGSDNSQKMATTAFVQSLFAAAALKAGATFTGQLSAASFKSNGTSGTSTGYKISTGADLGLFGNFTGPTGATGPVGATGATGPAGRGGINNCNCNCVCACE